MTLERTCCRENSFIFEAGDNVGPGSITVFRFFTSIKRLHPAAYNDRACFQFKYLIFLVEFYGFIFTEFLAYFTFPFGKISAVRFVDGIDEGNRLGIAYINSFALVDSQVECI